MKTILAILLLSACAGAYDDDGMDEIGQAHEAVITANCGGTSPQFGVDLSGPDADRCDRLSSTNTCAFPITWSNYAIGQHNADIHSGWSAAQRSALVAPALAASGYMDSMFTSKSNGTVGAMTPFDFQTSSSSTSSYVNINNVSFLPTSISPNFSDFTFDWVVQPFCTSLSPFVESLPAKLQACMHWEVKFDYNKLDTYLNARGLSGNQKVIPLTNILRKIALITNGGYGTYSNGSSSGNAMDPVVQTTANQTGLPGGAAAWFNNYHTNGIIPLFALSCVP